MDPQKHPKKHWIYLLIFLFLMCLIDNVVALCAIGHRTLSFGLSANKWAILGINLIVGINEANIIVAIVIFKVIRVLKIK